MLWRCPKCHEALDSGSAGGTALTCANGHCFDRARQGYVNLLLANQKHSRNPGDNAEMVNARQSFLRAGYYNALPKSIAELIGAEFCTQSERFTMLDLGCGEGYYLEQISEILREKNIASIECLGVDVSKVAIRKASTAATVLVQSTQSQSMFEYAVASTFDIPVRDHAIDVAVNIFAPFSEVEVARVLKPGGMLIRVQPGPRHLFQLKSKLYETPSLHDPAGTGAPFFLKKQTSLTFNLCLQGVEAIGSLLAMTPFYYHGKREAKAELLSLGQVVVDVDFDIQVLGVNDGNGE